jgi:uncharacterized protein (DUF885 family)
VTRSGDADVTRSGDADVTRSGDADATSSRWTEAAGSVIVDILQMILQERIHPLRRMIQKGGNSMKKHRKIIAAVLAVVLAGMQCVTAGCGNSALEALRQMEQDSREDRGSEWSDGDGSHSASGTYGPAEEDDEDHDSSGSSSHAEDRVQSTSSGADRADIDDWYVPAEGNGTYGKKTKGFDDFVEDLTLSWYSSDYLSMKECTGGEYEKYGLEKPDPEMKPVTREDFSAEADDDLDELKKLRKFDKDALSREQQVKFTVLERKLENDYVMCSHPEFITWFGGESDVIDSTVTSLSQFVFQDSEDFEDFTKLLDSVPDYLDSLLKMTEENAEKGYFITDEMLQDTLDEIDTVTAQGTDSSMITEFEKALDDSTDLTEEQKKTYREKVEDSVIHKLFPAFKDAEKRLKALSGTRDGDSRMCSLKNGDLWYELIIRNAFTMDLDAQDITEICRQGLKKQVAALTKLSGELGDDDLDETIDMDSAEEIMKYLGEHMEDFPKGPDIDYSIEYLDDDEKNDTISAYYVTPSINSYTKKGDNRIYVNPDSNDDPVSLYLTLAHEGLPGHMYQITWSRDESNTFYDYFFSDLAYSEGWAEYASCDAIRKAPMSEEVCRYYELNEEMIYAIDAACDAGFNGLGWSLEDAEKFLEDLGFTQDFSKQMAENGQLLAATAPGTYLPYGAGLLEFLDMYDTCREELGSSFDIVAFNTVLLSGGSRPLDMVQDDVDRWLDAEESSGLQIA